MHRTWTRIGGKVMAIMSAGNGDNLVWSSIHPRVHPLVCATFNVKSRVVELGIVTIQIALYGQRWIYGFLFWETNGNFRIDVSDSTRGVWHLSHWGFSLILFQWNAAFCSSPAGIDFFFVTHTYSAAWVDNNLLFFILEFQIDANYKRIFLLSFVVFSFSD